MLKTTIYFIAVLMCIAFNDARKGCPGVGCPKIFYPDSCRAVTFFIHGTKICPLCDQCKIKVNELDTNGCPPLDCEKQMAIPEVCRREVYYVYQHRTLCKDCPQNNRSLPQCARKKISN